MQRTVGWALFTLFLVVAVVSAWTENTLEFGGPWGGAKAAIWLAFLSFLGYSIYCSTVENIFKSIVTIAQLNWGRQIGADLYLGLFIFLLFVYVHQGSILVLALWVLPVLLFANLATLLYVALYFESIVARLA